MCLIVKPGCKPEIAQEDITCWKEVVDWDETKWMAPVRGTLHNYDEVLTACDRLSVELKLNYIIEVGFHAYTNEYSAQPNMNTSYTLTKCTIPKGAEYCLGRYNEIVTTKMIVHTPNK